MKIYMHSEEPELTVVIVWDKDGTIEEVLATFLETLKKMSPPLNEPNLKLTCTVKNSKGKELDKTSSVKKVVKHMDDLFVKVEVSKETPKTEKAGVKEKKPLKTKEEEEAERALKETSKGKNNAAAIHINHGRCRKAIEIYKDVLKADPKNKTAIKGMINIYKKAERFEKALFWTKKGFKKFENDVKFLQLQSELYLGCNEPDKAIECLTMCTKIARGQKGMKTEEKHEIHVLLAKAYLKKNEKDMALTILQGVLRENMQHPEALIEYAGLLFGLGPTQSEEAMSVLVSALARDRNNKNAKEKFAYVCTQPDGMKILKSVASRAMSDQPALMFLGNCLRDCSAIKEALEMFQLALDCSNGDPSAALIYVHTLEIVDKHEEILEFYKKYCNKYAGKTVGALSCQMMSNIVQHIPGDFKMGCVSSTDFGDTISVLPSSGEYTDDEKYLLAFFFTLVKVLYIKGCLDIIPLIVDLLQPLFDGKELHKTNIRNEAAYFGCISMIYRTYPDMSTTVIPTAEKCVYFIGDSHCIPPAWHTISLEDDSYTIYPVLSTGTKIWHLRPEGNFYPKTNFYSAIERIPDGATVIICLGEIDCREALLTCWEKARYDRIEDGMENVISIYIEVLKKLKDEHQWKIFLHPVLPVLDPTRPIVMQFNRILATTLLKEKSFHWLNFVHELLIGGDEGVLKKEYQFDGTHVHPSYITLLAEAMSKCD